MNEEYIKAIHAAYGEDKLGSYDDFYSEITSNKDYRDLVYNQLGGSDVFGDYNDFTDLVSIKQEQVQEDVKKKDTPQPYQPTSEEPTEVSRTDSGGIDFKALDEILPSNMQEAEEDVKRRIEQKQEQEQEQVVSSGQKANRVLNEVDKFAQSIDDFSKSLEQTPTLQSEWGPTSFEQATVEKSDEQKRLESALEARKQFGDDVQAYSQAKLEELKPQLDKEYQNLTGYDNEEFVIEQPDGSLAIDENAYNEATFFSEQFGELYKEVVANEAKSLKDASSIQKAVKTLGIGIDNLDAGIGAWFDPDAYNRTAFYNDAKVAAIKKSFGMTEQDIENGVIKNFTQGNVEAGLRNLTGDVLLNLPQVGVAILGGAVGAPSMLAVAPLGLSAGGSEYARLQSNPNLSEGAKMLIGAYLGAAEIALEGMAMGDIRLARQALSNLSADGRKQLARRIAKDFIKEGSIPVKAGAEEALEEALASVNSQFVESIIDPDKKFDIYEAGDAALVGFSSGAGIGVGNVITKTPSYIASYKNANKRRKVLDAVKKLNDIKSDPSSTEQDIEIANDALLDAKRRLASIEKSDAELYSRMSEGDVDKVISLNRRISRGLDRLDALKQEPESDKRSILKSAIENKLQSDFNEKKEIEKKYEVEDAVEEDEGAENAVRTFAERIAKGEDVSSAEDIQFYENNKQEVEDALRQMQEAESTKEATQKEIEAKKADIERRLGVKLPTKNSALPVSSKTWADKKSLAKIISSELKGVVERGISTQVWLDKGYGRQLSTWTDETIIDFLETVYVERRRQEELERFEGRRANSVVKYNPDGENTELTEDEIEIVENLINKAKEKGLSVDRTQKLLQANGFVHSSGNSATAFREFLKARLNGEIDNKVNGEFLDTINAKYDAELAALEQQKAKPKKETEDAVQEQAAGEVPVQPEAEVSGEMEEGVPDTEPQEAAQEGKKPRVAMLEGENKETARRRQRNTIKEKIDKSVVSKLPFLAKFNPEHSYTVAQAELIDKFIDEYVKTGSLKGSGNVEALINGVSNMASLKQKAKTGFRKIFFKFSYDSKDVNKIRAMSSSTLIAELFGSGFEKVLSAIGGTKWDASVAKSIKDSSNFIANIKPSMDKASATDVGQAGDIKMFAVGFVEQIYQRFVADVGEETAIKTAIRFLEKSIQTQQESRINSETLNLQKEALDLIKDETTIEGVLSKLTDGQRAVYESVIKANDLSIDEVQRISIENGKPLEKQNRYLHIPTRTTKNELKDLTPEEFLTDPDAIGYVNPFDTKIFEKTSGAQEARVKDIQKLSQAFEEGSLYLEPSFILQQHNSFFNTRLAVYSHQAIVQMNAALGAKEARDIFGGKKHNGAENISAVKDVIKRNMNANRISAYTLSNIPVIGGLYMSLKRNAIPLAMGSIVQPIKQGTVVITTAAELTSMVGRREAGSIMARSRIFAFDYFSEKARSKSKGDLFDFKNLPWNDLIMNSQVGVRNTLDALEFSDQLRNISIISSFAPARALRKKWNSFRDYWSAKSIVTPDRAAAQIGWLNYYEAYMIKNGLVEPSSFYKDGSLDADAYRDWYLEQGMNPNQDAVAYASNRILQYQGPSTQFERSELQGAKDFNSKFWNASYRLIRDTLFAMQSFSFGTSSTQMSSILQLAGKDFTKEDKRKALISLAGIGTSFAVFNGINVLLYKPLLAILTSLISEGVDMVSEGLGLDDDDENELNEKLKTLYQTPEDFRRALSIGATNTIIESSLPFLSQIDWAKYYVAYGVDFMAYSLGYTLYGEEMVKKYGDFGGGGFTVWQESSQMRPQTYKPRTDIGYLSIVPEDAYELYKIFNAGVTGEYDNGFGTKVYLNEKQREDAFKIAGFMAFGYGIPAIPATTSKLGVDAFRGVYHKASDNYLAAWMDDFTSLSEEKKKEVSEDFINNMNNYYKEQYDKILSQYGDEAISTLKAIKAIEYDIQDYSSTSAVKAMFAALDGKEKASEGNIDAFLFNLSNRNITPIAKGNIINQRLKKFDDKKERNEYYGRFVYSGLFLYNMDELRAIMNHVAKLNEGGNDSK